MDLRHLKYFIAVAEELNIGRAALRLNISQPPLTRQIQQLEDEIGVLLFTRTPKGVELTQAGEQLLKEAINIRALVEQATERTQRTGQGKIGRLDVGIFGSGIFDVIPKVLLAFRRLYPEVNIVLHTMDKGEQIDALRQRRITVGFNRIMAPQPDISSTLVKVEKLYLAINLTHRFADMDSISIKALEHEPLVLFPSGPRPNFIDHVINLCRRSGFTPEISQEVGDAITAVALVASGFGVCLVPESATNLSLPGVVFKKLNDAVNATVDLSCFYRKDDDSKLLKAFLEVLNNTKR